MYLNLLFLEESSLLVVDNYIISIILCVVHEDSIDQKGKTKSGVELEKEITATSDIDDLIGIVRILEIDSLSEQGMSLLTDKSVNLLKTELSEGRIGSKYEKAAELLSTLSKKYEKTFLSCRPIVESALRGDVEAIKQMKQEALEQDSNLKGLDVNDARIRIFYKLLGTSTLLSADIQKLLIVEIDSVQDTISIMSDNELISFLVDALSKAKNAEDQEKPTKEDFEHDVEVILQTLSHGSFKSGVDDKGEYYIERIDEPNSRWIIQNSFGYVPFRKSEENFTLVNASNSAIIVTLSKPDFIKAMENEDRLVSIFKKAEEDFNSEESMELTEFELPPTKKILHLSCFPANGDFQIGTSIHGNMLKQKVLQGRYSNLSAERIIADNVFGALVDRIDAEYKAEEGSRYFILDLYSHGDDKSIGSFKPPFDYEYLRRLADIYPNAIFQVETIACRGAGLLNEDSLSDLRAVRDGDPRNISILTQTRDEFNNSAATVNGRIYSTYYQLYFSKRLLEGATYGLAHRDADRATKQHMRLDPEAYLNGKYFGNYLPKDHRKDVSSKKMILS